MPNSQTSEVQSVARTIVQPLLQSNDIPTQDQPNIMYAWQSPLDSALANPPHADTQTTQRRSVAGVASHRCIYRSAIHRLPIEVLQAIFLELSAVQDDFESGERGYDVFNVDAGPWPLIRVSRIWRAAAWGCTELWATMSIDSNTTTRYNRASNLIALLKTALSHSGQRDLYIRFTDSSRNAHMLLRALVEHSNRWREVYLYMLSMNAIELTSNLGRRLERLKVLTYWTHGKDYHWTRLPPIGAFHDAPSLVELCVAGNRLHADGVTLPSVLKFKYCHSNSSLDAFSLCPNAEDVTLDPGVLPYDDDWVPRLVDIEDCIQRDRITRLETSDVGLLYHLCLPSLSDLSIFFTDAVDLELILKPTLVSPAPLPALFAFLKRSGCALTQLMLGGANLRSETASLADIFTLTPSLERLEISYGCEAFTLSPRELQAIHDGMSLLVENLERLLLPNLAVLVFASFAKGEPAFRFVNADFVAMCRTRRPTLQLASLHCLGCPQKGFPTLKRRDTDCQSEVQISVCGDVPVFPAILRA